MIFDSHQKRFKISPNSWSTVVELACNICSNCAGGRLIHLMTELLITSDVCVMTNTSNVVETVIFVLISVILNFG